MPHIHTEPGQHDLTASGFIVRTDLAEPKIVLHWHKKLNRWMQFGGHVELHENPWQAVAHEILEESGYKLAELRLLQPNMPQVVPTGSDIIVHPYPVSVISGPFPGIEHWHTDIEYAFVANHAPRHNIGQGESTDIRLFNRKDIMGMPDNEIFTNMRDTILYIFDECLPNWRQITPP